GLCLTEPHAGSDVQAILTRARRVGEEYRISGTKMFVTNGREGNTFALLAVTDPGAQPRHRGMSCFIVEKGGAGLTVVNSIGKLGYKGVDTAELLFEDFACPAANLVASETAHEVALAAVRLCGTSTALAIERCYRDTPLMIIGEGTNEIQRTIIARQLVERHGERGGGLVSRDGEPEERRRMLLAVRQVVEKSLVPVAAEHDREGRVPDEIVAELADLGVFAALVPPAHGGLGLDPATWTMVIEEVARAWAAPALLAVAQGGVAFALGSAGGDTARHLPALGRAETLAAVVPIPAALARRAGAACVLAAATAPRAHAPRPR